MNNYQAPIRFHQFRPEENYQSVAEKYGVDEGKLRRENPEIEGRPGEIVVINLRG